MRANKQMRQWIIKILMWLRPRIQSVYTYFGLAGPLSDAPAAVQSQASGIGVPGAHQSPPYPKSKMQLPGAHMWVLATLALGSTLALAVCATAQQGGQTSSTTTLTGSVAPTGNCGSGSLYVNTTTGDLYDCNAGSWLKVNGSGGSGAFSGGLGASFQDATEIAAPANPAAGNDRLYLSSATHLLACLTSSGANCMPAGGAGTVTQVTSGNFSPLFNVSVATNTSTPAFSFAGISQTQNLFFASPNGSSGVGAFRAIAAADVPASANSCAAHQFTISLASGLNVTCAQPVAADIGSIPGSNGQLLFNNAGAIGAEDPVISYNNPSETTAAWTSATSNNTVLSVTLPVGSGVLSTVMVTLNQTSTITGGVVSFLASDTTGLTNTYPVYCTPQGAGTGPASSYTLTASTNIAFQCSLSSFEAFEVKLSPAISGTGTVNVGIQPTSAPSQAQVAVVNFPTTQTISGTVTANAGSGQFNVTCTAANCPVNVSQFGGTNVVTGTGASGSGIPRVTLSNDSSLAANQSVNVAQVAGSTTSTATTGVQLVGIEGRAGTSFETTAGVLDHNLKNIGNSAVSTAASGTQLVGITGHANGNVDGATGAAPPANVIYVGGLGSGATGGDLLGVPIGDTYKAINISTATTTLLITGVASRQVRIGAIHFIAAGADNVALIEGTGATCGTGTAGMAGGTTSGSGYNLVANQGYTFGSGLGTVISTVTAGDSVCAVTSAAVQLSGGIEYTIY
jgi:hypothetical protein